MENSQLKNSQFYLLLLYSVLTCIVGFQIARILYYRHALYSFQLGFLLLCFIWGIFRIIFWSTFDTLNDVATTVLLWLPVNLQFATFSLLVVFYAHLVHKSTWERSTKKIFTVAYIAINATLLIMQCVWLGFVNSNNARSNADWVAGVQAAIAGLVFLILVTILAWYGYKLRLAIGSTAKHQMLFQVPTGIFVVTFIIVMLFLSRCVFDFMNIANKWVVALGSDKINDQIVVFFAYFSWEIVPTVMIVLLFWRIPTTHIGGITRRGRSTMFMLPPSAVKPVPSAGIVSRLFNDPQRYDSDDETTGFLHKGSPATYTAPPQPSSYNYAFGKNTPYATTTRDADEEGLRNPVNTSTGSPPATPKLSENSVFVTNNT